MPNAATVNLQLDGKWSMTDGLPTPVLSASATFGAGTTPPNGTFNTTTGTGVAQTNAVYKRAITALAAGANLDIDLLGGTGELDQLNLALAFARVRWLYLEVTTPGLTTALRIGPQAVANAWQGPWGGVAAGNYAQCAHIFHLTDNYDNWPVVDGTHKIVRINNPGAAAVSGTLLIGGHS